MREYSGEVAAKIIFKPGVYARNDHPLVLGTDAALIVDISVCCLFEHLADGGSGECTFNKLGQPIEAQFKA